MTGVARTTRGKRAGALTRLESPGVLLELPGKHDCYGTASGCKVICSLEPAKAAPGGIWLPPGELMLWHLSMSHPSRYPTWDEIADVRYELVPPDVTMAMLLPPPEEYLNVHETTLHLWQIDDRRIPGA